MFSPNFLTLLAYFGLFPSAYAYALFGAHCTVPSVTLDDAAGSLGICSNILSCLLQQKLVCHVSILIINNISLAKIWVHSIHISLSLHHLYNDYLVYCVF
jgi:hypothetical protein